MNDSELEDQLRTLSPVAPSPELAARIERELKARPAVVAAGVMARPAQPLPIWKWLRDLGWAGAGAAAALAAVAFFSPAEKTAPSASGPSNAKVAVVEPAASAPTMAAPAAATDEQAFEPTEASRELVSVKDSDQVLDTENGPVREVRYVYRERLAWAHPGTGARLEIEVPREDVYLLPVSLQ